jgi:hypothetical protein
MQVLGVAILACLTMSWANAQYRDADAPPVVNPAHEAQPATGGDSSAEVPSVPVIEVVTNPDLTQDQLMQRFRDELAQPPTLTVRRFADGALEMTTRFGHFCGKPLPPHFESGLGGDITLAAPCAWF